MTLKSNIIAKIIRVEGGYVNNPFDSGGETNFGITKAVARAYGYKGDMVDLPLGAAVEIYVDKYWNSVCGDDLATLSESIAAEVVDTAINMGVTRAATFLQRSLNILTYHDDIKVDGKIGHATLDAVHYYLLKRDAETLCKALNCLQGTYYIELAERREKDKRFIYGWLKNRVNL